MNNDDTVKITLSGKLAYSEDITLGQAAQIIAFITSAPIPNSAASPGLAVALLDAPPRRTVTSNPRDALTTSGAKTNPEKIVAFALYVSQQGEKDTFTLEEVKPLFRQAREATPGNMSRDLDAAIKAGWVAEADTKGEYYVTGKAHGVLETGFEAIRSRGSGSKPRGAGVKRARKAGVPTPEVFVDKEISPTIDGYPDYHKLKARTEKFLWAINAAKVLGVDAVTNQEVVWLTDRLGDGIASGDIAANFRQNHKAGYVNRSTSDHKIRILPRGIERLKEMVAGGSK